MVDFEGVAVRWMGDSAKNIFSARRRIGRSDDVVVLIDDINLFGIGHKAHYIICDLFVL